jgi:peptide/nickel transport system permease protein
MLCSIHGSGTETVRTANGVEPSTDESARPVRAGGDGGPAATSTAVGGRRRSAGRVVRFVWTAVRFARRKPLGMLGALIVLAMLVMALFAERIAPYPYDQSIRGARMKPSAAHWLGTDNLSRDMWSRIVYGARVSISVGFLTVALAVTLAAAVGVSSAYFGGVWDLVVQRVVDAWLSFPYLVIILSVMAVLGPGLLNVVASLALLLAATNSRVIRGATLTALQQTYVEAARAMGCGHARIILRHLLPNVAATVIILATIGLGAVILAESALSFLGFGVPPPHPSWGGMLAGSGRTYMFRAPWMAVWPGVAISLAVFGFNMLGDALRDVLDPRLRGS